MPRLDVRRLAAVDMYGTAGTQWRRRVITGEFMAGAIGCFALGLWVAFTAEAFGWQLFGAWLTGVGVNYLALVLHAVALSRSGALDAELAGGAPGPDGSCGGGNSAGTVPPVLGRVARCPGRHRCRRPPRGSP